MKRLALLGALAGVVLSGSVRGALTVERVVPVATDQQVRVRVAVKSDQVGPVELQGTIMPAGGGVALWQGPLGSATGSGVVEQTVDGLQPKLWSPGSPALYNLVVTARQGGRTVSAKPVRFGFRSFTAKDGQFLLNGHPIFMRGIAINPPDRDIPEAVGYSREFAHAYVKYLRSQHVNLIRMTFEFGTDPRQQVWFDACDELGMMVDQGDYGAPPHAGMAAGKSAADPEEQPDAFAGKDAKGARSAKRTQPDIAKSLAVYKEGFETYQRHPSVVIYVLSNELPGPNKSDTAWHEYLSKIAEEIHAWDPTRLIIGNAGYGWGREGDVADLHRYWGWYYNSFLTYYNLRDTVKLFGKETDKQPFTFSECVGSFTSPLGNFNAIFRKQLAPQLGWTGHSGDQKDDSLAYQSFMVKHALESFRTMREQNHRIAGLMPFTILFYNWEGIKSFEQMKPKPAMEQMGVSYTPVLTSIELWTEQVYAGTTIRPIIHVVNDAEDFSNLIAARLTLSIVPKKGGAAVLTQSMDLPDVGYFQAKPVPVEVQLPKLPTGDYLLTAVVDKNGTVVSRNQEPLYVAEVRKTPPAHSDTVIAVFDPSGATLKALETLGIHGTAVTDLSTAPTAPYLIIGQEAFASATPLPALKQYVAAGGRVLVLAQDAGKFDTSWLPVKVQMLKGTATDPTYPTETRPTADQQNVNPERPGHPIFYGVGRERLQLWSDYSGWNQSKPGFPKVFPITHGFKLSRVEDMAHAAILADYDRGLEGVAIAEMFDGKGWVLLTGLDLIPRVGLDPVADQMVVNLVNYLTVAKGHDVLPLVDRPIVWGNYPTERGVLTGPLQGLVYNCRWVPPPTALAAKPMPDNEGAWNTHPGNPFLPIGIRAFGPYGWSTGASSREESKSPTGSGIFYARVPAGRKFVYSKVQNPGKEAGNMDVIVNENKTSSPATIAPGKTIMIRTPIGGAATELSVRYTGSKSLVILETSFE
ncbi:MAG TPA: glycoside hydrolase family 2 TIM barrel-domain containing protein [Tepidisphaeraceae bacterium]|jgi:hypothetical protein|nr:glycoside hydrolase family 2 TIM barrel-domain containing protein [Tepidisphaeraceae bacterium]